MRVHGNGWVRELAAVVAGAAAPSGRPPRAVPWASPPAPAAQPRQPAAQPGRARPAAWPGSPAGALAGAGRDNEDVLRHAANRGRHTAAAAGP